MPFSSSGRRDFAPYTTPAQSHHPLRGFIVDRRPREFGSTLEPDAMEADISAEFTSGRRDIGPPQTGPRPLPYALRAREIVRFAHAQCAQDPFRASHSIKG